MTDSSQRPGTEDSRPPKIREISSDELFRGNRMVLITHSGEQYRLSITRNDKLILQK